MKLIVLNILISCVLIIKPCLSTEEKLNSFLCPDSSGTSLVTTDVSGCKVYYTCKDAVVTKIFQCSDSQILAGTTHVCQENPQCPGIDSFEELIHLKSTIEESKTTESDTSVVSTKDNKPLPASINTIISFIKCLVSVDNIDGFCNKCVDTTLFQERPTLEIEVSQKVFDAFAKILDKSKSSKDCKHDPTWDKTFGKVLKDFVRYLSPQCELVCKDVSKQPEHNNEDKSQSKPHVSIEDFLKQSSDDVHVLDQVLPGNRVRLPIPLFSLIKSVLKKRTGLQFPVPTVEQPTTPNSSKDVNNTLMSNVIVPFIKDFVSDEEAFRNATNFVKLVSEALGLLVIEMYTASRESFDLDFKPIIKIPRETVESIVRKISVEGYPILQSLLHSKLQPLLLLSGNTKSLVSLWDEIESTLEPNMGEFVNKGYELYRKYYEMFSNSSEDFIHTYSLTEIRQDIESLYSLLPKVSKELVLKNWSVFQDSTGITESISKMLPDVPDISDANYKEIMETKVLFDLFETFFEAFEDYFVQLFNLIYTLFSLL